MKRLFNLFLAIVMIFSFTCVQVYAASGTGGSGNIDGGGGSMGDATSHGSWNPGNEGVRVTVVRASDHAVVTTPFDLSNKTPSSGIYHFGKVSKIQYNNGTGLSPVQGGYADEGITGTSAKKRKDFLKMIRDCERGKIDLVITKSVSRFCRNTLDGLNYVRRLKRHGVGVYFEKENVNTLFMDNEMILTFMMSQAQAESESLSGNVKWGHRKNFKDGKVYYHCKNFLGYRWGADGQPEIDPEQAAVVRRIFSRFLLGHSVRQITADLMADGIKTATGKTVWHDSVLWPKRLHGQRQQPNTI